MIDQPKMFEVFREQHRWNEILGVTTIGEFNHACDLGFTNQLVNVSEALQEKKISRLADRIAANPDYKVILIAGPSSSGKTTFSKRLSVQLIACGLKPVPFRRTITSWTANIRRATKTGNTTLNISMP